jgi:hypothetical protein
MAFSPGDPGPIFISSGDKAPAGRTGRQPRQYQAGALYKLPPGYVFLGFSLFAQVLIAPDIDIYIIL